MKKKIKLKDLLRILNFKKNIKNNFVIKNITNIHTAKTGDITICHNSNYLAYLESTSASACVIYEKYLKYIPKTCFPIISKNPQLDFLKISNFFYNNYILDKVSNKIFTKKYLLKKFKNLNFGKNFICEKGVKIGRNVKIGHNVIIKENSIIGDNVNIGSNVVISHAIIKNNVNICDGSIIGKKGFGFKFIDKKIFRVPHMGKVIINENAEIGSNCNIDRGSISDTIIGKNTFLDNQVHVAHNVVIGEYCILAAQVGISGSSNIGNNVMIGGQSGISGHIKIGNNVKIGGKSGVIKNIEENKNVMGYPAVEFRKFIKKNLNNEE